jgi:hypothetical protein
VKETLRGKKVNHIDEAAEFYGEHQSEKSPVQ